MFAQEDSVRDLIRGSRPVFARFVEGARKQDLWIGCTHGVVYGKNFSNSYLQSWKNGVELTCNWGKWKKFLQILIQ